MEPVGVDTALDVDVDDWCVIVLRQVVCLAETARCMSLLWTWLEMNILVDGLGAKQVSACTSTPVTPQSGMWLVIPVGYQDIGFSMQQPTSSRQCPFQKYTSDLCHVV